MTRLTTDDIRHISPGLSRYQKELVTATGRSLLGLACHAWDLEEARTAERLRRLSVAVVPITAGEGVISDFSETVCAILLGLGADARVTKATDTSGVAEAFETGAHAVMMSDDDRFVGLNLTTRKVADNSDATGRVFAAALDLMAGGVDGRETLVLGCGPVGLAAARTLLSFGARVTLADKVPMAAERGRTALPRHAPGGAVRVAEDPVRATREHRLIVEATPEANTIDASAIHPDTFVTAPGVPLGATEEARKCLKGRLVHDTLELGVAAMAADLLRPPEI